MILIRDIVLKVEHTTDVLSYVVSCACSSFDVEDSALTRL